jgi:hypothetical protein
LKKKNISEKINRGFLFKVRNYCDRKILPKDLLSLISINFYQICFINQNLILATEWIQAIHFCVFAL